MVIARQSRSNPIRLPRRPCLLALTYGSLTQGFSPAKKKTLKLTMAPLELPREERRFHSYLRNLDTKGEVSPRRMKCPDGPSPRNSENQDSCSISSFRIAMAKS